MCVRYQTKEHEPLGEDGKGVVHRAVKDDDPLGPDWYEQLDGLMDASRDGEQRVAPSQWISHPAHNYIAHTPDIDFAIVKLAQNVSFSSRVKPVCLPKVASSYASKVATVSGWGTLNEGGNQPNTLQKVHFLFVILLNEYKIILIIIR